jgi:hypothetical protein
MVSQRPVKTADGGSNPPLGVPSIHLAPKREWAYTVNDRTQLSLPQKSPEEIRGFSIL